MNNVHSIIQVLKEKPELSREDWESNLLHSELVHLLRRSTGWIRIHLHYYEAPIPREGGIDLEALS